MKKIIIAALAFLGIAVFAQENGKNILTAEQKDSLKNAFGEDFVAKLETAIAQDTTPVTANASEDDSSVVGVLATQLVTLNSRIDALSTEKATFAAEKLQLTSQIEALSSTIVKLSAEDEPAGKPTKVVDKNVKVDATNEKFLFGIEEPWMAIDAQHPYNLRAYAKIMEARGVNIPTPMADSIDYETLKADLGAYYRTQKKQELQSFLATLPSLETIFPLMSGYQNQDVLTNLFLTGEFSQADNTDSDFDNVVKGAFKFEDEIITMYDVMFAHTFKSLKKIEKTWLGNLNKEGSDPMKWSLVGYLATEATKVLHNERERRRINGKYVAATTNVAGSFLSAADGYRAFFKKKIAEFKMKPFDMSLYYTNGDWTNLNAVAYIKKMASMVPQVWRDTGNVVAYVSTDFKIAYGENYRSLFGLNTLDSKAIDTILDYPSIKMIELPNLAPSRMIVFTLEGNIKLYEDKPGEMLNFKMEQRDWSLKMWSNWKESIWANLVGKKQLDATSFPDDYSSQLIWMNNIDFNLDTYETMNVDITIPSVASSKALVSNSNNTASKAITNITGGVSGDTIRLKCGHSTYGITIAASGNFVLSAAWNPVKGDTITLKQRADGKFVELARTTAATAATVIADGDSSPSMTGNSLFITSENTNACAITTLDDAVVDKVYTIYGAGVTHPSTIANAGNFVLTAAMTLGAGTWIKLQLSATNSKFYELDRG